MTAWTAILALLGVFVILGVIFFVVAPMLMRIGKKKRGRPDKKLKK